MEAFLSAVRNDFRVLWKGLERVRAGTAPRILVANMDRVLDTVEGYVSSIQQAFSEEEALLARDKQLHRQRLLRGSLIPTRETRGRRISDIAAGAGAGRARTVRTAGRHPGDLAEVAQRQPARRTARPLL